MCVNETSGPQKVMVSRRSALRATIVAAAALTYTSLASAPAAHAAETWWHPLEVRSDPSRYYGYWYSEYDDGLHKGIDYARSAGTNVHPVAAGVVVDASWNAAGQSWAGYSVLIRHASGWHSFYAHMSALTVTSGQTVTPQQVIGLVGSTGQSDGNHLHLEIWTSSSRTHTDPWPLVHYAPLPQQSQVSTVGRRVVPIIDAQSRISLYTIREDGQLWGATQSQAGGSFSVWSPLGSGSPGLVGEPAVIVLASGVIAVYARTSAGTIAGSAQSVPGGAFGGWVTIGSQGGGIDSDPSVTQFSNGTIGVYAATTAGTVAGVAQSSPGSNFGTWTSIGSGATNLSRKPALVRFADDRVALYTLNRSAQIVGSAQASPGSVFSSWSTIGTNGAGVTSAPKAFLQSGRVRLFATAGSTVATVTQASPGAAFDSWVNLGSGASAIPDAPPGVVQLIDGYSVYLRTETGDAWGTSTGFEPQAPGGWVQAGSGETVASPISPLVVGSIIALYAIKPNGAAIGTNQSSPGGAFGAWATLS